MQIFLQVRKSEKIRILKTVYGKHSIYFSDFKKKFKFSDVHVGRFCDNENLFFKKKYLWTSENKFNYIFFKK